MIGEPIVVVRRGPVVGEDRYRNPIYGPDIETTIRRCAFAPAGSLETVQIGRAQVVDTDTVYAPPGVDVAAGDRVRVRGRLRNVDGNPAVWVNPTDGRPRGVVIRLESSEG